MNNRLSSRVGWLVVIIFFGVSFENPSFSTMIQSPNSTSYFIAADRCADIIWKPIHDSDGSFSAVQCKGEEDDGRCFCYSPEGKRIFGWSWWSARKFMTCRCSRQRRRLLDKFGRNDVSLHCTENGNYEELQCDDGLCWCVEPKSGNPTSRFHRRSIIQHLPCYGKEWSLQRRYLRQCESKALARSAIIKKLGAHGRSYAHIDDVRCDDDGSYANRKIEKKRVYCVWKDYKIIDNYQSEVDNYSTMDCNCARDTMTYADENLQFLMSCQGNGNYESSQMSNGRPYCVDSDGFATTQLCDFGQNLACPRQSS